MNFQLIALALWVFALGLSFGSFFNVFADRYPKGLSLLGRSHCDSCEHQLSAMDLIPVFSYFFLGGKCRYCRKPFSIEYSVVELTLGIIFLTFFLKFSVLDLNLILFLALTALLFLIALIDFKYTFIPDELLIITLILALLKNGSSLSQFILPAFVATGAFYLLHSLSKGRAMGFGDVKFVFVMGLILPAFWYALGLYIAFLTGGLISGILVLTKVKKLKSVIAFGPFLSVGFLISLWLFL
jgi:leader peptidase (prepilin peptidase)/N-methyltransferase